MPTARMPLAGSPVLLSLAVLLAACDDAGGGPATAPAPATESGAAAVVVSTIGGQGREALRFSGAPVRVGNGLARAYLLVDPRDRDLPLELGVSLSDGAMEGLPAAAGPVVHPGGMHGHESITVALLELPKQNSTPYRFVELDWQPAGHEPAVIYGLPHFDFHFYTVSREERNAIVPADPDFAAKAGSLPPADARPPFYLDNGTAVGLPAAVVTVPRMGLHWIDVRSPEFQGQPFTRTFFIGSWDGRFIFSEPMITRAYLLARRDGDPEGREEVIPLPTAAHAAPAGFYPTAYRIAYDPQAREFVVGLSNLARLE